MKPIAAALAAVALGLALGGCGGDDEASPPQTTATETQTTTETVTETTTDDEPEGPTVVRITVEGGVPTGGIVREAVAEGDRVVLVVESDVADEVHLHGYDISREVAAGGTTRLPFTATIPGRFEVELEESRVPIAELTVNP